MIYAALSVIVLFFADRLIFHPPAPSYSIKDGGFKTLKTQGGTIAAYEIVAQPGQPTLLWSHGNAVDIGQLKKRLQIIHQQTGFGILAYDYPGYGASSGKPSEKKCNHSINAAYHYLTEERNINAKKLILIGQSVGSGPTCWLAARNEHAGVILISPFLSTFRTVTRISLFFNDRFKNFAEIKKISSPLLVIHGDQDRVIPFTHGRKLYELSPSRDKHFAHIKGAGHNDLFRKEKKHIITLIKDFYKTDSSSQN